MATTFDNLVTDIANEIQRSDLETLARIPKAINDGLLAICRDIEIVGFTKYVTGTMILNNPIIPKPVRWVGSVSLNYGTQAGNYVNQIEIASMEWALAYWPNRLLYGPPLYYSDETDSNYLLTPTPDLAYPFKLCYLESIQPLNSEFQTNFLTNNASDVVFYAALREMGTYLKNHQDAPIWDDNYAKRIASLKGQDNKKVYDRGTNRWRD